MKLSSFSRSASRPTMDVDCNGNGAIGTAATEDRVTGLFAGALANDLVVLTETETAGGVEGDERHPGERGNDGDKVEVDQTELQGEEGAAPSRSMMAPSSSDIIAAKSTSNTVLPLLLLLPLLTLLQITLVVSLGGGDLHAMRLFATGSSNCVGSTATTDRAATAAVGDASGRKPATRRLRRTAIGAVAATMLSEKMYR